MSRSTSGLAAGNRNRFTIRTLALASLVLALAGGAAVARPGDSSLSSAGSAPVLEPADLRRAEAAQQRVDRRYREAAEAAVAQAQAEAEAAEAALAETEAQRASRATDPEVQPAPPPPPPPPASSGDGASGDSGGQPGAPAGPVPESCSDYSGNRATGCTLLLEAGFTLDQMSCLDSLWTRESGWNHQAQNPSSGAYGIPQSLPGDKMASAGSDWQTNPATQIRWGLGYIEGRYGTPCAAWAHSESNGWY